MKCITVLSWGPLQICAANSNRPRLLDHSEQEGSTDPRGASAELKSQFAVKSAGSLEKVMSDNSKEKAWLVRQQTLEVSKRSKWTVRLDTQSRKRLAPLWPWELWMLPTHPFWLALPLLSRWCYTFFQPPSPHREVLGLLGSHKVISLRQWDFSFSHLQKSKYSHTYHLAVTPQNSLFPFQVEIYRFVTLWGLDEWSPVSCQEHRQLWLCAWLCCAAVN